MIHNRSLIFVSLLFAILTACSGTEKSSDNDSVERDAFQGIMETTRTQPTDQTMPPPLPTTAPTRSPNQASWEGWNVYVTNIQESPSGERGWKSVTLDVVFESTDSIPYPLYAYKYVSILDSTGNWRQGNLCCSKVWGPDEMIQVPTGVRFMRSTEAIRVPENATLDAYKIEVCGSSECSPQYAVFTVTVFADTPYSEFTFPASDRSSNLPLIEDGLVAETRDVARFTFRGTPWIDTSDSGVIRMLFHLDIENLTGNDLTRQDVYRWRAASVTDTGHLYADENVYCTRNGDSGWQSIPPAYTDSFVCQTVISYDDTITFDTVWVGLAWEERGPYFAEFWATESQDAPDGPHIEVLPGDVIELGDVMVGSTIDVEYTLRNSGDASLYIFGQPAVSVIEGCCPPRAVVSSFVIEPGDEAMLSFSITMIEGMEGSSEFRVDLQTNDPEEPVKSLTVRSNWVN